LLGVLASVHGAVSVVETRVSENTAATWSTLPFALLSSIVIVTSTGLAPSVGADAANDDRFEAASRIPVALVARATVKLPTDVSAAPGALGDRQR
jgi:hypothetical protein